jgi:hypothetical protein
VTLPYPGPEKDYCGCGCGKFGTLKAVNSKGYRCVQRCVGKPGEPCKPCLGRTSRRRGKDKQRSARKALKIPGNSLGTDEEELWRGTVRVEVKSGHMDTMPVDTRYRKMRDQSDASRAIGDNRPFAAVCMPPGSSDGIVMIRLSEVFDFAQALLEAVDAS